MRLVSAVLGFALRKAGLFVALVVTSFLVLLLVSALVPTLREAEAQRDRLVQATQEREGLERDLEALQDSYDAAQSEAVTSLGDTVGAEVEGTRDDLEDQEAEVADRREERDEACGTIESLVGQIPYVTTPCEAKQAAYDAAVEAQRTVKAGLERAEADLEVLRDPTLSDAEKLDRLGDDAGRPDLARQIASTQAQLERATAEQTSAQEAQDSWAGRVVDLWDRSWRWLALVALLVIVMPAALRTLSYFVLMPLVSRAQRPLELAGDDDAATAPTASLSTAPAERTLAVHLVEGEVLSARSEHVRPVQGSVRSRLLYDWSSPFISFAAGLYGLSRVTGDAEGTLATLATPDDPDSYLMRIDFTDHPGVVVHPRHVVGVIGAPTLRTRWRWGITPLARWQVRYIMFAGTGSLVVQGTGDVRAEQPAGRSTRMDQNLVMGFDSRLHVGVRRTEAFVPYLWGRTALVTDEFTGAHPFLWQKSTTAGSANPVTRTFNAFFSVIGKVLGF
ncbi:hypothetical protein [Nocardioides flavescens]|uniref:Uncharacterized protein n=1 Tax=Nocardioides flavescens TaxID=2691959 RepID=A0A6L7EX31_9ACTN|nr:hypothetical protein [Nocardioides flavescens]MXG88599.1 hypothetical protein [Nocardioides flavescens]